MTLGLIVIGRNDATALRRLLRSVRDYDFAERIYVDAGSADDSVAVASEFGMTVAALDPRHLTTAAAARRRATLLARSEWLLYLDSDMVPDLAVLDRIREQLRRSPSSHAGLCGLIRDVYSNGTSRIRRNGPPHLARQSSWLGGALLLRRNAVLECGNWNPAVLAYEELDLYARFRKAELRVGVIQEVLVNHHTSYVTPFGKLLRLLNWKGQTGPRFGGLGQALGSSIAAGSVRQLIQINPDPFITPPLTGAALIAAWRGHPLSAAAVLLLLWLYSAVRFGPQYLALSYLACLQIPVGLRQYRKLSRDRARMPADEAESPLMRAMAP